MCLLLAACAPRDAEDTAGPSRRLAGDPSVILISIDTLRADHLPAYGYDVVETPALDALRADGILFEKAYSHIPLTLPAHTSLLTGLLPPEHGVRDNVGYRLEGERADGSPIPFLPRLLKDRGYVTGAAVSTYVLRGQTGLDRDFDFFEDSIEFRTGTGLGGLQRPGDVTLRLSRDWLRGAVAGGKPFFFFFHIYEPHTPYRPPEPYASRYASPYDGEVAAADAVVGELIAELRRLEVYDKALIVLLSDHGEGLGEHGEDEHGILLYAATLHVPLILKLPGSADAGRAVSLPVQHIDVVPTLVELLDLPRPAPLPGRSLLDFLADDAPRRRVYSETYYPRLHFGWSELASLIDGEHHYIEGPDPEIYALEDDPGELHSVLRDRRRLYAELRAELARHDRSLTAPEAVDAESREALAALGYLGSTVAGSAETEAPLADPKTRLGSLTDLRDGFRFRSQDRHGEAVEAFRRVLVDNPRMLDAWEYLGRSLQKLGRRKEALEAFQEGLRVSGGSPHLAISVASLLYDLGRYDEAAVHARLALDSHPSFAHGLLARIAFTAEDLDEAEREARLALDERHPRLGPEITLAAVFHARGDYEAALGRIREIEETYARREARQPDLIRGLYVLQGKVYADLTRTAEAEVAFKKEIELFPDALEAYSNLALLYGLTGRAGEVSGVLREMVESRPEPESYAEAVRTLRILDYRQGASSLLRHALGLYPDSETLKSLERTAG